MLELSRWYPVESRSRGNPFGSLTSNCWMLRLVFVSLWVHNGRTWSLSTGWELEVYVIVFSERVIEKYSFIRSVSAAKMDSTILTIVLMLEELHRS